MKIKKGIFRIYIVVSIVWSMFWFFGAINSFDTLLQGKTLYGTDALLIAMTILPLPLYFVLKWILKGFE